MWYQLVIFDLDGTILNTLEDLKDSVNYALGLSGYPLHTLEEVRSYVGNGIRKLIERAVPAGVVEEDIVRVHQDFTEYYKVHCADKTRPYTGIVELLKTLKAEGYKLAVVSNKADYGVQELCKQYYDGIFDFAVGEREGILKKPSPDSVNEVLRVLQVDRSKAVYVGDSDVDIQTARNAGMECISVTWGFRDRKFLEKNNAYHFAQKPEEILQFLSTKQM